jgi:hypothetical protein
LPPRPEKVLALFYIQKQPSSGMKDMRRIDIEQNFEYMLSAEQSPEYRSTARGLFSFWKEIDFQAVLM